MNLKRLLRGLPKPESPDPSTAKGEQSQVLQVIGAALITGNYDFTSRRSIRIYCLNPTEVNQLDVSSIEVEWKINE